jgi:hypothetical protein
VTAAVVHNGDAVGNLLRPDDAPRFTPACEECGRPVTGLPHTDDEHGPCRRRISRREAAWATARKEQPTDLLTVKW